MASFRGHELLVIRRKCHTLTRSTLLSGLSRNNYLTILAALISPFIGIKAQTAVGFALAMAGDAVRVEDWVDLFA